MLNVDSQEWWMWQMYRATAEFMHDPNIDREAQLKFFIQSYRHFHQQQSENSTAVPRALEKILPTKCLAS